MARPRSNTAILTKEGHSVSLKVLRLSRPQLAQQHPIPHGNTAKIARVVSLVYPSEQTDQDFILSPSLSLPPAFGSAYVGETLSCTLCANNELSPESLGVKAISGIRLTAEIQTPSQTIPLQLHASPNASDEPMQSAPGSSVQRNIHFDLKEEGNHTLSIGVNYSETTQDINVAATSGRARTFRKMYQFVAQPCLGVRTKVTELAPIEVPDKALGPYGRAQLLRYVLEAQLENVSDSRIILNRAILQTRSPFKSTPLNDSLGAADGTIQGGSMISPRDVLQVAFIVEQEQGVTTGLEDLKASLKQDGRTILGQIALQWRSQMGEKGALNTGNLFTRRR